MQAATAPAKASVSEQPPAEVDSRPSRRGKRAMEGMSGTVHSPKRHGSDKKREEDDRKQAVQKALDILNSGMSRSVYTPRTHAGARRMERV